MLDSKIEKISCIADLTSFRLVITQFEDCQESKITFKITQDGSTQFLKKKNLDVINTSVESDDLVIFNVYCKSENRTEMIEKIKSFAIDNVEKKVKKITQLQSVLKGQFVLNIRSR